MPQDLRARLKEARKKLGLTQVEAAKAWRVPLNTLICWENNRRNPSAFTLAGLNQLLDGILGADPPAPGAEDRFITAPPGGGRRIPHTDAGARSDAAAGG